jgi:hypothetical protein
MCVLSLIFIVDVENKRVYIQLSLCIISTFCIYFYIQNSSSTRFSVTGKQWSV